MNIGGKFRLFAIFILLISENLVKSLYGFANTNSTVEEDQKADDNWKSSCGSTCDYDEWFLRAQCEDRGLRTIPFSTGCEDAVILDVNNNNITRISSDCISNYTFLETLDLSQNLIEYIVPGLFQHARHLRNIFLSRNKLTELENGSFNGVGGKLERLFLDSNNIMHTDVFSLTGLYKLKSLTFSNNRIKELPGQVFGGLTRLQYLHLSRNRLSKLHGNIFRGLSQLKSVSLDHNYLRYLPAGLFLGLRSLTSVDISYNRLLTIDPPEVLGLMNGLTYLNLYSNKLNSTVSITPYLQIEDLLIKVSSNPLQCDCSIGDVQKWFERQDSVDQLLITNRSPLKCRENGSLIPVQAYELSPTCSVSTDNPDSFTTNSQTTRSPRESLTINSNRQTMQKSSTKRVSDFLQTTSSLDYDVLRIPSLLPTFSVGPITLGDAITLLLLFIVIILLCIIITILRHSRPTKEDFV